MKYYSKQNNLSFHEVVALAVSFEQISTGLPRSDWGEGAITVFRTMSGSPYRFQFHITAAESAVAHCCIVGPTGQGKTTMLTFLAGQAMRHGDLKVYLVRFILQP